MSLVKYNNRIMNPGIFDLLSDIFSEDFKTPIQSFRRESIPAVNVKETEKEYSLEMAVPGLDKKDVNVEIEEDILTISHKMKEEKVEDKENYKRKEFSFSSFKRSFNLPEGTDVSKIEAKQENGVLHINIPKSEVMPSVKKQVMVA